MNPSDSNKRSFYAKNMLVPINPETEIAFSET